MQNLILFAALFSFLNFVHVPVCTAGPHLKPQTPINVAIIPSESALQHKDEHVIELTVTVTTAIDQQGMDITIKASKGAEIVSGEVNWAGSLRKGEEKVLVITARASKAGRGKITAMAEASAGRGALFRAEAHYEFGNNTANKQKPASRATKDSKGRGLIEYEVR